MRCDIVSCVYAIPMVTFKTKYIKLVVNQGVCFSLDGYVSYKGVIVQCSYCVFLLYISLTEWHHRMEVTSE